jgi:hypothetical protein
MTRRPVADAAPSPAAGPAVTEAPPPPPAAERPATNTSPAAASRTSTREQKLLDDLRRAFQASPDTPETPERTRERYVWAIESLANYLEEIGADAATIERIDELGWALEDLSNGELSPLLKPTR